MFIQSYLPAPSRSIHVYAYMYIYIYTHTCIYSNKHILLSVRLNTDLTRALSLYPCVHIYTEIPKIYTRTYREIDIVDHNCLYIHLYLCRLTLYLYTFLCTSIYMYTRTCIVDYRWILYRVTEMHNSFCKRATSYVALLWKWPIKIRHPMGLRQPTYNERWGAGVEYHFQEI